MGLALRLYLLDLPLLESQPNRQLMDAFIIRQLYQPHQPPQVDFSVAGLPVYHSLVAALYFIFGGENLLWGRVISVIASLVNLWLFILISRLFISRRATLVAAFLFFVLSPVNIALSRAIQIEQLTLTTGMAAIYTLILWQRRSRPRFYWLSLLLFTLTLGQEATLAYLSLPLITIFYLKDKRSFLKSFPLWFYFLASFIVAGCWYFLIMAKLNQPFPNGWNVALNPRIWVNLPSLISLKFWINAFYHFTEWAVTPLGTILFVLGLFSLSLKRHLIFIAWFLGALTSIIYRSQPAIATSYYFFTFVPPAAVIAAQGLNNLLNRFPVNRYFASPKLIGLATALTAILVTWRVYVFSLYGIHWKHSHVLEAAQQVKLLTPSTARVIASSYSSGILQFYMDRPGYSLVIEASSADDLTNSTSVEFYRLKNQGAQYYVISDLTELDKNLPFKSEILRYQTLYQTDKILLVNLNQLR